MESTSHRDPAAAGAKQRLLHSSVSAYGSMFVRLLLALAARVLLARLILPDVHGLFALALQFVVMASAFRDVGLTHHLMRDPRESWGTVLAWSVGVGSAMCVLLIALANVFSYLNPDLPGVLRAMAIWIVIDAVIMVYRTFFERRLRIREIVGFEILRSLAYGLIAVGLAHFGAGVWSFVAGELLASALFALLLLWRARGQVPLTVDWRRLPGLIGASRYLFVVWAASQVFHRVDIFFIELFSTTTAAGHYEQAYYFAFLVALTVTPRPLLPALVEFRDNAAEFAETLRLGTLIFLSGVVVSAYFLYFNAGAVQLAFGPEWAGAVPLLQVLCLVPLVDVFTTTGGEALKVQNRDRLWLITVVLNMLAIVGFGFLFTWLWGPIGMAWANFLRIGSLLMLFKVLGIFAGRRRRLVGSLAQVYLLPLPFFLAAAALLPAGSWGRLFASVAAAALGGGLLAVRFLPDYRRFFRAAAAASVAAIPATPETAWNGAKDAGPNRDAGAAASGNGRTDGGSAP